MKFTKEILREGTFRLPDGRTVRFTRRDLEHLRQRFHRMSAAGLKVPLVYEHQDCGPVSEAEKLARSVTGCVGWLEDAAIAPDGALTAVVDVPLPEDADRVSVARYCSPEIDTDITDGSGFTWSGPSVTHLAVTTCPIIAPQDQFRPIGLSRRTALRLSLHDFAGGADDEPRIGGLTVAQILDIQHSR